MNENNIIHRDLKLENILIKYNDNNSFNIKITDYGSNKKLMSLSRNCSSNIGTTIYMASEILNGEKYNYKCDLWSLGIIIYKLYFGKSPFPGESEEAIKKYIEQFGNKLLKKTGNEKMDDLIKKLLEKNPSKRLNWAEYLNHPFFKNNFNNKRIILKYKDYYYYGENFIFGEKFVEKNKKNIDLIINGEKSELISKYKFKQQEIKVEMIIKNQIINLEGMFYNCYFLIDIEDLKNLDMKEITNFSDMFYGCWFLSNIKPLQNWNVSNGNNFSDMFSDCT
jgi:serine/threonine protein kinase